MPSDFHHPPLYTPTQRARRDATKWTLVQAILAPVQFLVFLVSLALVARYLATGLGYELATASIIAKTIILYVIMVTGSIWEKVVFDEWLFADAFFWEDVFSMLVLGLQTLYLVTLIWGIGRRDTQMGIALAAYATYVINAAQFVWKLRQARLEGARVRNLANPSLIQDDLTMPFCSPASGGTVSRSETEGLSRAAEAPSDRFAATSSAVAGEDKLRFQVRHAALVGQAS